MYVYEYLVDDEFVAAVCCVVPVDGHPVVLLDLRSVLHTEAIILGSSLTISEEVFMSSETKPDDTAMRHQCAGFTERPIEE